MAIRLPQKRVMSYGATRWFLVDFTDDLASAATISSATVTEVTSTDLTIATVSVLATATEINGVTVAIGKGIQFKVSGQKDNTTYMVLATIVTSDGETVPYEIEFGVE